MALTIAVATGCSGDDAERATGTTASPATTSTTPDRPTTTTSLVYDPATVEGQVEQAYLKSWDVYAEAVYTLVLDEAALTSVYADPQLGFFRAEIGSRVTDGRSALHVMRHSVSVEITGPSTAVVFDEQVNHQVLIDRMTKQPTEADPNNSISAVVQMDLLEGVWKVSRIDKVR